MRAVLAAGLMATAVPAGLAGPARAEIALLMFEQPGCLYCAAWNEEVAPEYPLTDEGRAAPLRRLRLREALPEGIVLDRPAVFTPTFVLVSGGVEVGRIEGYVSEDFFWPLLGELIDAARR
ncbi:MAG: thioredoxin family protein [Rhodobacteraceae bacterium]|nr:thioredoxin family protein [Paracoccaceae bacterium]